MKSLLMALGLLALPAWGELPDVAQLKKREARDWKIQQLRIDP